MRVKSVKVKPDLSDKPYSRCLSCPKFRKYCGGMPTRGMDLKEWCAYIRVVMDFAHLTNAYVAREADVSLKTMEWISAGNITHDIMRSTARQIEMAVLGDVGQHICEFGSSPDMERINKLLDDIEYWKAENDRKAKIIDRYLNS